jgi:2-polyprenyl-3-methyl-5-hydroxy-6-metoxy-1,4-benzoquinol methylase
MSDTPSPIENIFATFNGFHRSAALRAAIELDLFGAIAAGDATPATLAARTGASPRGVRILADALGVLGFLQREADGRYVLVPDYAPFLTKDSPLYLGSAVRFLHDATLVEGFANLTEAVRRGGAAPSDHDALAPNHAMWVEFARAMAPLARVTGEILAILLAAESLGAARVLDVAAGHGMFGIALATRNPAIEVTALDWPNVLAVAVDNARAAGVAAQLRTRPGDAFTAELGSDYELVLVPNLIHHFDPAACETLFRRVHTALKPGGRIVLVEFVPDEDRRGPATSVMFGLVMLAMTPGGDVYTFDECAGLLRSAGFRTPTLHELTPSIQRALIAEK